MLPAIATPPPAIPAICRPIKGIDRPMLIGLILLLPATFEQLLRALAPLYAGIYHRRRVLWPKHGVTKVTSERGHCAPPQDRQGIGAVEVSNAIYVAPCTGSAECRAPLRWTQQYG